ncbi:MAG: NADH-quinone oxidoreductase subunit NuoK [Anaerolineaceae bacterium]|nr:NADH-quinone oxidoreductase subunit NuoK [Anaerolineaceae bacterium]
MPLSWYLIFAAGLFVTGIFGVLTRRNVIGVLMGVELMLNAVNINLLAFWSYLYPESISGLVFIAIVFVAAAAETAVGLALIISIYRRRHTVYAEEINLLRG